jgi:hypothetical protein
MPGDGNGTIAAAWQRTQRRQRVRHSDTNGTIAYADARGGEGHTSAGDPRLADGGHRGLHHVRDHDRRGGVVLGGGLRER